MFPEPPGIGAKTAGIETEPLECRGSTRGCASVQTGSVPLDKKAAARTGSGELRAGTEPARSRRPPAALEGLPEGEGDEFLLLATEDARGRPLALLQTELPLSMVSIEDRVIPCARASCVRHVLAEVGHYRMHVPHHAHCPGHTARANTLLTRARRREGERVSRRAKVLGHCILRHIMPCPVPSPPVPSRLHNIVS